MRVFGRLDPDCPRCQELLAGAPQRPGWKRPDNYADYIAQIMRAVQLQEQRRKQQEIAQKMASMGQQTPGAPASTATPASTTPGAPASTPPPAPARSIGQKMASGFAQPHTRTAGQPPALPIYEAKLEEILKAIKALQAQVSTLEGDTKPPPLPPNGRGGFPSVPPPLPGQPRRQQQPSRQHEEMARQVTRDAVAARIRRAQGGR